MHRPKRSRTPETYIMTNDMFSQLCILSTSGAGWLSLVSFMKAGLCCRGKSSGPIAERRDPSLNDGVEQLWGPQNKVRSVNCRQKRKGGESSRDDVRCPAKGTVAVRNDCLGGEGARLSYTFFYTSVPIGGGDRRLGGRPS